MVLLIIKLVFVQLYAQVQLMQIALIINACTYAQVLSFHKEIYVYQLVVILHMVILSQENANLVVLILIILLLKILHVYVLKIVQMFLILMLIGPIISVWKIVHQLMSMLLMVMEFVLVYVLKVYIWKIQQKNASLIVTQVMPKIQRDFVLPDVLETLRYLPTQLIELAYIDVKQILKTYMLIIKLIFV